MWCVGDHCFFRALDVGLKVMVSSTLAASLTCLSLFSCDSILFSFSPSLSSLGGSILLEEPRLVSLLLLLTQLVFCISCPLIFEPCLFFVYRPLTDSCFLITFLFRTGPDVSFWFFSKQETKNRIQIVCLICFSPGALRT